VKCHVLWEDLRNNRDGNLISDLSLLPLLPSVQILFHSSCEGPEAGIVTLGRRTCRTIVAKTQFLIGLCFLCYLLFKSSSILPMKDRKAGIVTLGQKDLPNNRGENPI
jgi:hypothetical protein